MKKTLAVSVALLLAAMIVACSSGDVIQGNARVQVMLTDAPSDLIEAAEVQIHRVVLVPGEEGSGGFDVMSAEESPMTFDLMQLRDGVTAFLADGGVPEGTYRQLRLIVETATVTLVPGVTFRDGTDTAELKVPSGMQTGIKVKLDDPIIADDGSLTIVTVDFDVDESFVVQGQPPVINSMHFQPVLKEKGRSSR